MEDYFSPLNVDHAVKYDGTPRTDILEFISSPPGRALEIGCSFGATGALIKQRFPGTYYAGVELDGFAAAIAARRLDRVIAGNVENIDLEQAGLAKESFDLVICADVLEHLYDPWKALYRLRDYLKPDGKLIAVIPNIQNMGIIMHILNGNWTYQDHGLLDATHIRFFTINEIEKLFHGTGYRITRCAKAPPQTAEADEIWPKDMVFGRLVLKDVSREEAGILHSLQFIVAAEKDHGTVSHSGVCNSENNSFDFLRK